MTTVLFIGDQHFKIDNITEVDLFVEKITKLAEEKKPDLIILAGDLLDSHERLHTIPLNKAYDFINKMRNISETYVLVGNHDMINHIQFLSTNHWLNGLKEWKNTTIVDTVVSKTIKGIKFVFSPFVYPGRFEEALNTLEGTWKDADCIFAHQEFAGCKMGAIVSIEGDKWSLDYPEVISGHIHSNQTPQKNIYYPGSSMQHSFGESSKNIIAYLTFEKLGEKYSLDEIDLSLPRKKIVYMDVENIDDYKLPETEDKIKITVSGSYDQFKAFKKTKKYKKLVDDGVKVVFKTKKIKEQKEEQKQEKTTNFETILNSMVNNTKNCYLLQAYELVVNSKKIKHDDIVFISPGISET